MVVCVCFFNIYLFLLSVGDIDQLILSDSKLREEKYNENKKYLHSVDDFNACKISLFGLLKSLNYYLSNIAQLCVRHSLKLIVEICAILK